MVVNEERDELTPEDKAFWVRLCLVLTGTTVWTALYFVVFLVFKWPVFVYEILSAIGLGLIKWGLGTLIGILVVLSICAFWELKTRFKPERSNSEVS